MSKHGSWTKLPTTNNTKPNTVDAASYKVVGSNPAAAFFFIWMFNLEIANGAKVGQKLRPTNSLEMAHLNYDIA